MLDRGTDHLDGRTPDIGREQGDLDRPAHRHRPDHPELDDRDHRELRVHDLGEGVEDRGLGHLGTCADIGASLGGGQTRGGVRPRHGPGASPRDPDLDRPLAHHVAPGSAARTEVNSPQSQRKASP